MSIAKFAIISKNNKTEGKKVTLKKKLYFFSLHSYKDKSFRNLFWIIFFGNKQIILMVASSNVSFIDMYI